MDEAKNHHLLRPLQPPTTTNSAVYTTTTAPEARNGVTVRLLFIASIALISVWANYEASKEFSITIINEASDTSAGKNFDLFYVSNDRITRLILERNKFVENFLYPISHDEHNNNCHHHKKEINHVVLRLSSWNLTSPVTTESGEDHGKFVIRVSPSIMNVPDFKHATFLAVQRGMTRIWLWDGQGNAPASLVNGMVDYITSLSVSTGTSSESGGAELPEYFSGGSDGCWKGNEDSRAVGKFLSYCEGKREGFVRKLNQEMKNVWHDGMVDDALGGMPARMMCDAYRSSSDLSTSSI